MRIALAHKRLDLNGGTERDLYRSAEGLNELGHEVHLFCAEFGVPAPVGTFAHRVPVLPLGRTARLWSFAAMAPRMIRRRSCDVVVGFGRMLRQDVVRSGGGSHLVFLRKMEQARGAGRRLWHRLSPYHRSVLAIERRQFAPGGCRRVLCVSREVRREIVETYGVPEAKTAVIYNGVDEERFHPSRRAGARDRIRRRWSIPEDAPVVLFAGSGFGRKGLDRLLRVWGRPRLQKAFLVVVGEDAQRGRYRARAERAAPGRVVFAGRRDDIEAYYGAADLLALPAVQEAFGNVVLEALACGLPVLVSRTVGAAEILSGELALGIVDDVDDDAQMEVALAKMIELSRFPQTAAAARKLAEGYSWRRHFRSLEDYLREAAAEKRRGADD